MSTLVDVLQHHTSATASAGPTSTPKATVRTAIAGVSGYAGAELARLLLRHPRLSVSTPKFFTRPEPDGRSTTTLESLHPQLATGARTHAVRPFDWRELEDAGTELLFLATPHEQSRAWAPEALARGIRVVDLSGAWRLHNRNHRAIYQFDDEGSNLAAHVQSEAVYGCPELHSEAIAGAMLVANPGCYATSIILALVPFTRAGVVDLDRGIICDAKSGVSGAGKAATATTHFMYAADNLSAYSVFSHRHTGELLEQLHLDPTQIRFTPHLLPIPRGILSSIYLRLNIAMQPDEIQAALTSFYAGRQLIRVYSVGHLPQIQYVVRNNFCDLGFELDSDGRRLFLVSCLDNLLKGAAGQAVQNMNLMCGWDETEGLL